VRPLKTLSVEQLVTDTKLSGSAAQVVGHTTPEHWPFIVVVAVAKPGNELAVQYAKEFAQKMQAVSRIIGFEKPDGTHDA
jgi:hypothetical protein